MTDAGFTRFRRAAQTANRDAHRACMCPSTLDSDDAQQAVLEAVDSANAERADKLTGLRE